MGYRAQQGRAFNLSPSGLWRSLTEAWPEVVGEQPRQQAKLLASLLLVGSTLLLLLLVRLYVHQGGLATLHDKHFYMGLGVLLLLAILYPFSRTRHYRAAAVLAVFSISTALLIAAAPYPTAGDTGLLGYLLVPMVVASLLLPVRFLAALIALALIGTVIVLAPSQQSEDTLNWVLFMVLGAGLIGWDRRERSRSAGGQAPDRRKDDRLPPGQNRILELLAYANEQLVRAPEPMAVLPNICRQLGRAANVSRVYIVELRQQAGGTPDLNLYYQWLAAGSAGRYDSTALTALTAEHPALERWLARLTGGEPVYGQVSTFPDDERALLEARQTRSMALMPVIDGRSLWGFVGLDDCEQAREWSFAEIEALRNVAVTLGAAVVRQRSLMAEREQRALSDALREMAALLSSTLQLDDLLERILLTLPSVVPHDAASIMLLDDDNRVRIAGSRGYYERAPESGLSHVGTRTDLTPSLRTIIDTGKAFIVNETRSSSDWYAGPVTQWVRAHIGAPIAIDGQVIGFLNVDSATPGCYSSGHADLLCLFANQAAVAIRNAQLFQAEREQRALSDALRDVAAAVNSTLNTDEVLERILANVGRVVPHEVACIMRIEEGFATIIRISDQSGQRLGEGLVKLRLVVQETDNLRQAYNTRQPVITPDTHAAPDWIFVPESRWIRSHIVVPIIQDDAVSGFLELQSSREHFFQQTDAERLRAFADQAAIALRNAELYHDLSRYTNELALLYRCTSDLFTSLPFSTDLNEFGTYIARMMADQMPGVGCGLFWSDAAQQRLLPLGQAGRYTPPDESGLARDGAGLVAVAARSGQIMPLSETLTGPSANGQRAGQSEVALPLITPNGVLGVLHVQHAGPEAFDQEQMRILKAFAERAAAALENRMLYAEVRRYTGQLEQRVHERTTDLSVRNAVAETLSSSLDMIEMLDGVLQTTVQQLGVLGGAIYLLNADGASLELAARCGVSETVLELVTGIQPGGETARPEVLPDLIGRTGISAVLSVPIWRQEQVQGVISLVHDQPRPWSAEESRMLDAIGRQIGVALANARLYAEAVRGEAHIRAILSNVADGLLVFDHDDCPVLINPAAERLLEFFPAQSGGPLVAAARLWSWLRVRTQKADAAEHLEFNLPATALVAYTDLLDEQCARQGCPAALPCDQGWPCWLRESELRHEEMALCAMVQRVPKRAVQASSTPIYAAEGTLLGTVIALHDVTYYRQLDELKDRFVSTVSHELRTPLSTVLLQISTLNKYYNRLGEDERREMMVDIEEQAHVLRELIEDILELSRFDARRDMPQMQWFDLAELCRAGVTSLRAVIQNKDLQVDLAGCPPTCYLNGDQNQLARAFHNLLSNAIKYTAAGGQIVVGLEQTGPEVRLSVEDTGIGIAPEDQRYIFDRFFRAEGASLHASGTGLGLAITKEIIDLHRGRIELKSWPGQGSTFTLILPTGAPDQPES